MSVIMSRYGFITLLVLSCASAARVKQVVAAESGDEASHAKSSFVCPDECQQCCTAHSWDIGIASWGVSGENFKCILKDKKKLPDPGCEEASQRKHSTNMYKTQCPYPTVDGEPWQQLKKTPCSKHTKCCCDSSDDWTENVCLDATEDVIEGPSNHENAHGKMQKYVKTAQTYSNTRKCVGNVTAVPYQVSYNSQIYNDRVKCCIATEKKETKVMIPGSARYEGGYMCSEEECAMDANCHGGANWCGEERVHSYETKVWDACKAFQVLFYCAEDKLNPSQTRYKRVSAQKGVCMGENTEPAITVDSFLGSVDLECPAGWSGQITGNHCQCKGHCGSSR